MIEVTAAAAGGVGIDFIDVKGLTRYGEGVKGGGEGEAIFSRLEFLWRQPKD